MRRFVFALAATLSVAAGSVPLAHPAAATSDPGPLAPDGALGAPVPALAIDQGAVITPTPVTMEVVLSPSDPAAIRSLLATLQNPASAQYHHWLSAVEFDARFGPSPTAISQTESWLRSRGLAPVRKSAFGFTVSSDTARVAEATGTVFHRFRAADGATGMVALGAPLVPGNLRPSIQAVMGLTTLPAFRPLSIRASPLNTVRGLTSATLPASSCPAAASAAGTTALTLDQLSSEYGISTLIGDGLSGAGQTIGLYELAKYSPGDVSTYESACGLTNPVTPVDVGGGATSDPTGTVEADLDIEQAATQAPGASIKVYDAPNTMAGAYDEWAQIMNDSSSPSIVSTSWGSCEADYMAGVAAGATPYGPLFAQAATEGKTILAASGDSGSEDCAPDYLQSRPPPYAGGLQTDYPGSDPNVISVGGTTIDRASGTESTWNTCGSTTCAANNSYQAAGGGGESLYQSRPSWQPDVYDWPTNSGQSCGSSCREVPDLSANSGYPMEVYTSGAWNAYEGTSFAAPMMAGMLADRAEACSNAGGMAKTMYDLLKTAGYGAAFSDITSGSNDMLGTHAGSYTAHSGYDLATGLGSPQAPGLACPVVRSLSVSSGGGGDVATVDGLGLESATITFGGLNAVVDRASATSATVEVPASSQTGPVDVQATFDGATGNTTSHPVQFTYTSTGGGTTTTTSTTTSTSTTSTSTTTTPTTTTTTTTTPTTTTTTTVPSGGGGGGSPPPAGTTTTSTTGLPAPPAPTAASPVAPPCNSAAGPRLGSGTGIAAVSVGGCPGYLVSDAAGKVSAFGSANTYGDLRGDHLAAPIIAIQSTPDGRGYWLLGADGGVFTFGHARFYGSTGGLRLNAPVIGMAVTPDNRGYWIVAKDGGIFSFGDARFFGSTGNLALAAPVDGIAVAPGGNGYWLVAADGGVFTFTRDGFYGSLGGVRLARPVVGMSSTPDGHGYTLVGSDGGVFSFGDAPFLGSLGGRPPPTPVVDIASAPGNDGYYLLTGGGAVYAFGPGARFFGSV